MNSWQSKAVAWVFALAMVYGAFWLLALVHERVFSVTTETQAYDEEPVQSKIGRAHV